MSHGMQEPTDVRQMIGDTECTADDASDPLARPDLPTEPVHFRPTFHERGELRQLLGAEPRLSARRRMASQPFHPLFASAFEPLAHRTWRHAQCRGHVLLFPARLLQLPGAPPPFLAPVELGFLRAHAPSVSPL
jgi:hypothetical protein